MTCDRHRQFTADYSGALITGAPGYLRNLGPRFLAISDVHGANRLDVAAAILAQEAKAGRNISAVLILGDLVNYGLALELRVGRFARSLRQLAIPVLVVLGNHDKHGPKDTSVARYLGRIPNVHLMQREGSYHFPRFENVTIGGFDDPRYFGDDNRNNARKQQGARRVLLDAAREQGQTPRIVMVHEPSAAGEGGPVWVCGHMHSPRIDVTRRLVQVGMFTSGAFYYHRKAHRAAPSNFMLFAASEDRVSVASVTFTWTRATAVFGAVEGADVPVR